MILKNEVDNITTQMRKGMLEYAVLLILNRRRAYAPDILAILQQARMIVVEGSLYTLLNRLKREENVDYQWEESPKGPPRKYYSITDRGRALLAAMTDAWDEIQSTVSALRQYQLPGGSEETTAKTI